MVEAEALYRKALEIKPDEPDALNNLAVICFFSNRHAEALDIFLRALSLPGWLVGPRLGNIAFMLKAIFVGKTLGQAAKLRIAYTKWKNSLADALSQQNPTVSIVVPVSGSNQKLAATLLSVYEQTYANIEVVIVIDAAGSIPESLVKTCPFPCRIIESFEVSLALKINQGIHNTSGEFINIIVPGDKFDKRRIEAMVSSIVHKGGEWGFTRTIFTDAHGQPLSTQHKESTRKILSGIEAIHGLDATGFALLQDYNILVSPSNLFFKRAIFDATGEFINLSSAFERDFALKAVLQAEPFYLDDALLICEEPEKSEAEIAGELEQTKHGLRHYYTKATMGGVPRNPFAPVLAVWGNHFIAELVLLEHLPLILSFVIKQFVKRAAEQVANSEAQARIHEPGLDLVGFFRAEVGLAESARGMVKSCLAGNIPFSARPVELYKLQHGRGDASMDSLLVDQCSHKAVAFLFNPDAWPGLSKQLTGNELNNRYKIGYWYWETEQIPDEWQSTVDIMDEFWVATEFVAEAMRKCTSKPVIKIHPPIVIATNRLFNRSSFGLEEGKFLFIFSFDFYSFSSRKNPYAVLEAFIKAFPLSRKDVGLVIKTQSGTSHEEKLHALQNRIKGDNRITLINRRMPREEVLGLQSVCDSYVSLHRSEGLGLGLAECMAQGKAVIGTAYSGNIEFMNSENSCLVDYIMTPILPGEYLYDQENVSWAEPDIEHAAFYMQKLADDKDFYNRIAAAAKEEINQRWTYQATANAIRKRLTELGFLS